MAVYEDVFEASLLLWQFLSSHGSV
jgi:hypothetical protein